MVATPSAYLRHMTNLLPLLPSGPGGVHKQLLRRHQWSHHCMGKYSDSHIECKYLAVQNLSIRFKSYKNKNHCYD